MKKFFYVCMIAVVAAFAACTEEENETITNPTVKGKYTNGTFVLNEGNMSSEQGFLTFISPKGEVIDSAYYKENNSSLGNSTQDLFITNNKMYIISQNGGGDGMLVVANAATLKKEMGYDAELKEQLSMPTHIGVIGDNAYIRDNNGVWVFNTKTEELTMVEGTEGAAKNRMVVMGDKVFVPANQNIYVLSEGKLIETIAMEGTVSGIVKADDNNLYVSCTTQPAQINKMSATDYSLTKHELAEGFGVSCGWGATPGISAKGDTIYFCNDQTIINRHIFSENKTEVMTNVKDHIENGNMVYNSLSVHPVTGEVYMNTIKGWGSNFLINDITVFNFSGEQPVMKADYKNHTHFPAGFFFTASF